MPALSEADRADAEWFLAEMMVIFPQLGIDAFEAASDQERTLAPGSNGVSPELTLRERGAEARGREVADGFIVLRGSRARSSETQSMSEYMRELRRQLLDRGVLSAEVDYLVFTQDFRFDSPSAAAGVMVGGSANGRIAWKDEYGVTLKELQDASAEAET